MCRWRRWRVRRSRTSQQCLCWACQNSALRGCVSSAAQASVTGRLWSAIAAASMAASMNTASGFFWRPTNATLSVCQTRGSETWLPMLPRRLCIPGLGAKEISRSAGRKPAWCAPERIGWSLGFNAISGKLSLTAMLESLLRRRRQRRTPQLKSAWSRAMTKCDEGPEDYCETRMECITLATQPRCTSSWASSITQKRCRAFL